MSDHTSYVEELEGREEDHQYLLFRLGEETYAVSILRIKEIIEYGSVTAVPMMPRCLKGVINLRGKVVPVVDLAIRFGRAACEPGRRTCIVIVELEVDEGPQDFGLLVDAVNQVVEIPPGSVLEPPALGSTINTDFIAGMGQMESVEGGFVICLAIERVLDHEDITSMTHVLNRDREQAA